MTSQNSNTAKNRFYMRFNREGNSYSVFERGRTNDFGEPYCVLPLVTKTEADHADHICDPTARPPIHPESCPACLSVAMGTGGTHYTPTPWYLEDDEAVPTGEYHLVSSETPGDVIAVLPRDDANDEANATFIVRAVNSHTSLLAACRRALAESVGQPSHRISAEGVQALRSALALAEYFEYSRHRIAGGCVDE